MPAFSVVRFRVKPGRDEEFLTAHKNVLSAWPGVRHVSIVKTGERSYCLIAEWPDTEAIVQARPQMIETLNGFRPVLEDLGNGLGVTDAVSGPAVLQLG